MTPGCAGGTNPVEFNEWVKRADGDRDPQYYDKPRMFMPQVNWISDEDGRSMIDFVGRLERLQEDFQTICQRIGTKADLPHEKRSPNRDYRRAYTPATADIVARWFARDVEEFAYSFE